jgi:serine/threonine protein kinase
MRELSLNNCRLDKRYDIVEQLGRGSYAEIFIARDILASPSSPHSTVVIKALNVFLQNDLDEDLERTLVENFQNEAIALDRVRHPNIISRLGHGTARDLKGTTFHYLVLEYMEGGDLQRLCREGSVKARRAMGYVEQVCAGLGHAHSKGVIHRDIKPHNLLLTKDLETVKIADFGVARFSASVTPITRVGTNVYAPPEHSPLLSGQTGDLGQQELTPAADIYSLAKSVYTLFTCESPRYYANKPIEALPQDCREEAWADALLPVLNRATHDDPKQRQQTVGEFWSDLGRVREIIVDAEPQTLVHTKAAATPKAHVSHGYSPLAPIRPRFDTSRDLRLRFPAMPGINSGVEAVVTNATAREIPVAIEFEEALRPSADEWSNGGISLQEPIAAEPIKERHRLRRVMVFMLVIALFGGALYATGSYIRGTSAWESVWNPFHQQTGTANTDVNLRAEPDAGSDAIGMATRNSRVRIVNSKNNWYQVDIIQQGRDRTGGPNATRGWLNGRFIDLDENQ